MYPRPALLRLVKLRFTRLRSEKHCFHDLLMTLDLRCRYSFSFAFCAKNAALALCAPSMPHDHAAGTPLLCSRCPQASLRSATGTTYGTAIQSASVSPQVNCCSRVSLRSTQGAVSNVKLLSAAVALTTPEPRHIPPPGGCRRMPRPKCRARKDAHGKRPARGRP